MGDKPFAWRVLDSLKQHSMPSGSFQCSGLPICGHVLASEHRVRAPEGRQCLHGHPGHDMVHLGRLGCRREAADAYWRRQSQCTQPHEWTPIHAGGCAI